MPPQAGDFTFTVQATDDVGASVSGQYVLRIDNVAAVSWLGLFVVAAIQPTGMSWSAPPR